MRALNMRMRRSVHPVDGLDFPLQWLDCTEIVVSATAFFHYSYWTGYYKLNAIPNGWLFKKKGDLDD